MKIHYNPKLLSFSRTLRKQGTLGEVLLWKELKGRKLGVAFMRQKPVGEYIVDFYCSALALAVEVDGISHDARFNADVQRQQKLEALGITLLRFTEQEVRGNLDSVVREIRNFIQDKTTPASPTRHPLY